MMLKKIALPVLIVLAVGILALQIAQMTGRGEAAVTRPSEATVTRPSEAAVTGGGQAIAQPYNYLLYRQDVDGEPRYWAVNGATGRVELSNVDPVLVIEKTLERIQTNSKIVFAPGGWYLERPLVIKGKHDGDPAKEDRGLQEVSIDASQVEFVMAFEDKASDFITIDTFLGSSIDFGPIAAEPEDGFAALRITPTLPSQHTGTIGAYWSRITATIIQGGGTGAGMILGGSSGKGDVQWMNIQVGAIGGFSTNVLIESPGDKQVIGNEIKVGRNIVTPGGVGIQEGTQPTDSMYNNHYTTGVSSVGGIGLSIYGNNSQYDLLVTEGDPGKIVVLEPGAKYNILNGNANLSLIGYTDNSGNDTNRISGWRR